MHQSFQTKRRIHRQLNTPYREGGAQALMPKPKGRPKGSVRAVPPTREEELAARVRKLEAQVAYLKKSIALKAQRRSQTGTKP